MNTLTSFFCKIFLAPIVSILFVKGVKGTENFPKTNFILASNHQSYLDIIISAYSCVPRKFVFIGQIDKGKGFLAILRDILYFFGGVIGVDRHNEASKKNAIKLAIDHLKNGYSLIIYPEGKRSTDGTIQGGKWGVARLFLETGIPIIPARIDGAYELFPPRGKMKIKRNISFTIGKPLDLKDYFEKARWLDSTSDEYKEICIIITEKLMDSIRNLSYEN
ncbi:1-acyl-sn-glycerol-3-phosphate acyltransferase [bacterium]|nr:1-acyl-sn-glycerol-3-phosphate acyltransferase [bacterium]